MMIDDFTQRPGPAAPPRAKASQPCDLLTMLARVYREAGLSTEVARRCALADFQCNFPQLLSL